VVSVSAVERVDARGAQRLIAGGAVVIDVLPRAKYDEEHLPGAISVPLETFTPTDVAQLDRDAQLLVYCFDQH
jgi:rhodanese-related sulfurtransferase